MGNVTLGLDCPEMAMLRSGLRRCLGSLQRVRGASTRGNFGARLLATSSSSGQAGAGEGGGGGWLKALKLSSPDDIIHEDPGYSKWRQVPFSVGVQLALGSIYAFSVFNLPLTTALGVVGAAGSDWTISSMIPVFGTTMSVFGVGAAGLGRLGFFEKHGPRFCCLLGATCQLSGFLLGGLGVYLHSLPLLYMGYGVLGGAAMGVAYVPAVAVLIKWFPNQKGLAGGLAVVGYGAGGIIAAPAASKLISFFRKPPEFFGSEVETIAREGKVFAKGMGDKMTEVVYASASELSGIFPDLLEGYYVVGTGSSGAAETFACMGIGYSFLMAASALNFRHPSPKIESESKAVGVDSNSTKTHIASVSAENAMKTPQFWLLWTGVGINCTSSYAIIASGKTLMTDTFGSLLPTIVTPAFAGIFVSMISVSNLMGRITFSTLSDKIGRRAMFFLLWGGAIPLYLSIPLSTHWLVDSPSVMPLGLFYTSCMLVISGFGATAATFPAYISDLFGPKNVAAIHGQVLSVLIPAGYVGPLIVSILRERAMSNSIHDLASKLSPQAFEAAFGASRDSLDELIQAKVVTIRRLLEILPDGTTDPSPFLYDDTMMVLAAMHMVALGCVVVMRPVQSKLFEVSTCSHHEEGIGGRERDVDGHRGR
ncbi:hypothetical protein AAMO2058_000495800 [Amorphochlora amoebiformis]